MYMYIYIYVYLCIFIYIYHIYIYIITVKLTSIAFHFQCKTLFTIMIYIDAIMKKCNSSSQL